MKSYNFKIVVVFWVVYQVCFNDPIRLAASIDAEENAKLVSNVSSSLEDSTNKEEDGDYDEDEEMILVSLYF